MLEIYKIAFGYIMYLALSFAYIVFSLKRLMTYMHVLQQEDYESSRLLKWMFENKVFDKSLSSTLFILGVFWFFLPVLFINFLIIFCFAIISYIEKDPRKHSKKKLVITSRTKRIFLSSYLILIIIGIPLLYNSMPWLWILSVQIIPFVLIVTNILLEPLEKIIQKSYWNKAHNKIQELQPKIIAITGSYGKTSVKHILGHILKTHASTLITPGSVNTPMGITRIIREELDETHKYFIVEMGAYGSGSIKRLCELTPPHMGIITSIGHAHFERFKSLDTVSETKFELAEAVINKENGGKVIIHERTLRFDYPHKMKAENKNKFIVCGESSLIDAQKQKEISYIEPDDLHIKEIKQMPDGLHIDMYWTNNSYLVEVPLYGIHHGHNTVLAFATAMELGLSAEDIQTALRSLPQITHRLDVKKQPDGTTLIDDAFNSNPIGFRAALDLLCVLSNSGRAILITPGMVELGITHDQTHHELGIRAGEVCDIVIVVNPKRIKSFIYGFKSSGENKTLIEVNSFTEASQWLGKNKKDGDVILIENDLPDMYESIPKL